MRDIIAPQFDNEEDKGRPLIYLPVYLIISYYCISSKGTVLHRHSLKSKNIDIPWPSLIYLIYITIGLPFLLHNPYYNSLKNLLI